MTGERAPARLVRYKDLDFVPRFEHGDVAQLAEIVGPKDGTSLGVGLARISGGSFEWTVQYDEVLIVLLGDLKVHLADRTLAAGPHEAIWLPKGTTLRYEAEEALIAYAIHPADWAERGDA